MQLGAMSLIGFVSGLAGAVLGSWRTALKIGEWKREIELRIRAAEKRLERGDGPVGEVPLLAVRLEAMGETLRGIQQLLRDELPRFVSREECERRHEHD